MIRLKPEHIDEIVKNGEGDYPYECCGILFGKFEKNKSKTVERVLSISNARDKDNRHNRFLITPEEMMRAESAARKNKTDILGFYHSHPDHPAAPSQYDMEHAWPLYSYIIVSVKDGKAGDITSWELETDRSKFNPEILDKGGQ
ncbi:MAG: M67 family metallopeptidase [Brevinematales bacterium]|jgi:proteasome lid subunit RPN8/RPN11